MIVVGTAGHIDHGKSSLVRLLTGTDPDRLPEEKARGMTIDLGFAFLKLSTGVTLGFVDVPGHERFVRNMVAGATGFDVVMLVVAADDGWMPQTEEHFQIVNLLGVHRGFVVINKTDLSTPETTELLELEIKERVVGSVFADSTIVRASCATPKGVEPLRRHLELLAKQADKQEAGRYARLYIDRVFAQTGVGHIVTGTLKDGSLSVGDDLSIWPSGKKGKIRSLESMGRPVTQVLPGTRTAVSIGGLGREVLIRGGVVTTRPSLNYLKDNPVLVVDFVDIHKQKLSELDGTRAVALVGTSESRGVLRLVEVPHKNSRMSMVLFKADSPLFALVGDRCILRTETPVVTIGGGVVLDQLPAVPRRRELAALDYLPARVGASTKELILSELAKRVVVDSQSLLEFSTIPRDALEVALKTLLREGEVEEFKGLIIHKHQVNMLSDAIVRVSGSYLTQFPHKRGMPRALLSKRAGISGTALQQLLGYLIEKQLIRESEEGIAPVGAKAELTGAAKRACDDILRQIADGKYAPPDLGEFTVNGKAYQQASKYIVDTQLGHRCGSDFIFGIEAWNELLAFAREKLAESGELTIADLKGRFNLTRKHAIPVLEEFDRLQVTVRSGSTRVKGRKF